MADSAPVSCPEPERWSELADPARRDELEGHLDECADCRELVGALARVGTPPGPTLAPELATRGAQIGRYVVEGPIGAGGMGVVLAAYDEPLDRTVALKLVRVLDRSPAAIAAARERLVHEARAMARLAHPNVVAVHEVVATEDELFIVMERVDGPDLAAWLVAAPRTFAERLHVVLGAARGIGAAHAAGLVHRDVKPANILIGSDGRARITDLGLAAAVAELGPAIADGSPGPALASRRVGTAGYLAPEVLAGARADARADQYAFAVTAWQALYGESPAPGRRERGRIGRVLGRALAERAADRYPTIDALVAQLERAARPRWPRYIVAGLALAAIGLGVAWWHARGEVATTDCASDPTVGGTWTAIRRAGLGALLAARDQSPEHRLAGEVLEVVDARARSWSAAVSEVCTARVRGTESAAVADRRGECLEGQRRQLDALLAAIAERTSPSRALTAVARLPVAAVCEKGGQASVEDPLHRELRAELAAVTALRAAGKPTDALARLTELAKRVPADDARWSAIVAYRLADLKMRAGDSTAALPLARDAVSLAERAHDDESRFRAMIVLLQITDDLGRATESTALAPLLEAAGARQQLDDGEQATLENTLGNVAHTAGNYEESERHYRAALAAIEREYGGVPAPEVAGTLDTIANSLHGQGKVAEARDFATRSLAMFERTVGPGHPDTALPVSTLGTLALEAGDLDAAATYFERVIAIRAAALGPEHPYLCEPTSMLGQVELRRGHVDRALELQRRAIVLAERGFGPKHPLVAVAQFHAAEILASRDELAEARELSEASVKIWDESGTALPEANDVRFLLARLVWPNDHARARMLAETGRAAYAAMPPPYNNPAKPMAAWLATHR